MGQKRATKEFINLLLHNITLTVHRIFIYKETITKTFNKLNVNIKYLRKWKFNSKTASGNMLCLKTQYAFNCCF